MQFEGTLTKKKFEAKIAELVPNEIISYRVHTERNFGFEPDVTMTLYYDSVGHVATHRQDNNSCCIFPR